MFLYSSIDALISKSSNISDEKTSNISEESSKQSKDEKSSQSEISTTLSKEQALEILPTFDNRKEYFLNSDNVFYTDERGIDFVIYARIIQNADLYIGQFMGDLYKFNDGDIIEIQSKGIRESKMFFSSYIMPLETYTVHSMIECPKEVATNTSVPLKVIFKLINDGTRYSYTVR